ncbi:MAG: hypothetical protein AAGI15_14240 [Pseudomonadota bacterium]
MALLSFNRLFRSHLSVGEAANDPRWDGLAGRPAGALADGEQERVRLRILDFDLHQRDLGQELATELQNQVLARLQAELGPAETLAISADGCFDLHIQDSASVDIEKFSEHLMDQVYGEAFSVARALVECELVVEDR